MDISEIKDPKLKRLILDKWAEEDKARGVAPGAISQQDPRALEMAPDAGAGINAIRSFARITLRCFRCRSLDDENPFTKYFVDSLRYAGAIFDDSKAWAKIEVVEEIVETRAQERTEIEVEYVDC